MQNFCTPFRNSIAQQKRQLQEIENLMVNFISRPDSEKTTKIQQRIEKLNEEYTRFRDEYEEKVSEVMLAWFAKSTTVGWSAPEMFEIDEDGMVSLRATPIDGLLEPKGYWPNLIKTVTENLSVVITADSNIHSLNNTEEVRGTLLVRGIDHFSAPSLVFVSFLNITEVDEAKFSQVKNIDTLEIGSVGAVDFSHLARVHFTMNIQSLTNGIFPELVGVGKKLFFMDAWKKSRRFREVFPVLREVADAFSQGTIEINEELDQELREEILA